MIKPEDGEGDGPLAGQVALEPSARLIGEEISIDLGGDRVLVVAAAAVRLARTGKPRARFDGEVPADAYSHSYGK